MSTMSKVLQPLCDATADLVADLPIWPNDRLEITTSKQQRGSWIIQAYAMRRGERVAGSQAASYDFFARLVERKEIGFGRWVVAATDFNAMLIQTLWDRESITFGDDEAKLTYTYLVSRFAQQTITAYHIARFKETGELPDAPEGWVDHPNHPLSNYQKVAAWSAIRSEGFALFMEQGTGKTPASIAALMHLAREKYQREGKPFRCIITCPKNVKTNWAEEIHKFATVPGRVVVMRGGKNARLKQLVEVAEHEENEHFSVVICSYESISRTWEGIRLFDWDLGIADESDMFKSPWAKRSKDMIRLRDKCKRRIALTGTPVNNSILDLYYQLEWLDEGMSGFNTWKAFRTYYNKYAEPGKNNYQGAKVLIGFQNLPILHERLARVAFRITKKEAMPSLPDKTYDVIECSMGKMQKKLYGTIAKELAAELESALDVDSQMTVNNILTKLLRLSQITSGYAVMDRVYDDDGNELIPDKDRIVWFDDVPKMDELVEIVKNKRPDEKIIVWACWVPAIYKISERLTEAGVDHVTYFGGTSDEDRALAQERFNKDPSCKVFIGNPAAGGVGMNLPGYDASRPDDYVTNASHTIYYACNWSFRQRAQSEDRNHGRDRCRGSVRYTDMIVPGTIDVEITRTLKDKKATALEAQDVRVIMDRLLSFDPASTDD